jgi:hypothetical protein
MDWIDSSPFSRKRRMKNFLLFLLALIAALAMAEVFLRQFMPIHFMSANESYRYDREMGFVAKPGYYLVQKDYQQEFRVNPLGTVNMQEDFRGYEGLIFTLGDSYTQGLGVPADASYPFQLELLLNLDENGTYRRKYGVVNLGLSSFGGEQSLIALKRYIGILGKPALVLYLGSENDYSDDQWFKSGGSHRGIVEGNPYWGWMYYPAKWCLVDMEIGKRLKYMVSQIRINAHYESIGVVSAPMARAGLEPPVRKVCVARQELDVIGRVIRTAEENGARVILSWSSGGPSYQFLKAWAEENGYVFADWARAVDSVLAGIPALPVGNPHSGGHYRTWVNHLIAREYARQIKMNHPEGNRRR